MCAALNHIICATIFRKFGLTTGLGMLEFYNLKVTFEFVCANYCLIEYFCGITQSFFMFFALMYDCMYMKYINMIV